MLSPIELELFGKVLLAGLLGFMVGLERELMGSAAGDRTFSLVAIGSALFTALSFDVFGQVPGESPGRIAANVLTGVGSPLLKPVGRELIASIQVGNRHRLAYQLGGSVVRPAMIMAI